LSTFFANAQRDDLLLLHVACHRRGASCCCSIVATGGAFGRGMRPRGDDSVQVLERFQGSGRGRAVLTASSAMEYA
jgi:hypothetical protein